MPADAPLPYRAIALDLDGTLLDSQGKLPPGAKASLAAAVGRGMRVLIASGRMSMRIIPTADALGISLTLIAYNGAQVLEKREGEWRVLETHYLPEAPRENVFRLCDERGLFLNIYAGDALYAFHPRGDFSPCDLYHRQTGATYAGAFRSLRELPRDGIIKLLIIETPERRDRLHAELAPRFQDSAQLVKSNPEYLEFLAPGITKGKALEAWLRAQGLGSAALVAFGDAENDLEMLRLAGLGIALANATPGLRAAFPRLSPWSNDQEGVARELGRLLGAPVAGL